MIYTPMIKKAINILEEKQKGKKDIFGYPTFIHTFSTAERLTNEVEITVALLFGVKGEINIDDLKNLGFSQEILEPLSILYQDNSNYDNYIKNISQNEAATNIMIAYLYHIIDFIDANDFDKGHINENNKNKDYLKYLLDYKTKKKRDVYKDSFFGFVVGDALGVPLECTPRVELKNHPVNDMIGFRTHMMPPGTWSDDTSMTLAELDSISEKEDIDYYDIMDKFVSWCRNNDYTGTGVFFDIGNTTKKALTNYTLGNNPLDCGCSTINDNGNGSLMRMLPFVIYSIKNELNEDDEVKLINEASGITHNHEISKLGCKIYCDIMKYLFNGKNIDEIIEIVSKKDYKQYYSLEAINAYKRILDGSIKYAQEKDIISHGYVVSTLEAAIWSLYNSVDYSSAVLTAINLGGDTDTVAAVTGSLAGAYYGMIPTKWIENVSNIELVDYLYNSFIEKLRNKDQKIK